MRSRSTHVHNRSLLRGALGAERRGCKSPRRRRSLIRALQPRSRLPSRNVHRDRVPSDYPEDWKEISKRIRMRDNLTCRKCKVRLDERSDLRHVYYKNGDKSNLQPSNRVSRCILCHQDEHSHLPVTVADRRYVEGQRTCKGLSLPQVLHLDRQISFCRNISWYLPCFLAGW